MYARAWLCTWYVAMDPCFIFIEVNISPWVMCGMGNDAIFHIERISIAMIPGSEGYVDFRIVCLRFRECQRGNVAPELKRQQQYHFLNLFSTRKVGDSR